MVDREFAVNGRKQDVRVPLGLCLATVHRSSGKTPLVQASEIARLAFGPGKITPQEYYYYRLYDDSLTEIQKRSFIGKKLQDKINRQCNNTRWWAIAHDKLLFYGLFEGLGYPLPRTQAIYHRFRQFGAAHTLRSARELGHYLRNGIRYPFFAKPVAGMYSEGVLGGRALDQASGGVTLLNGDQIDVDVLAEEIGQHLDDGYIFQQQLDPHPRLSEIIGERVSTVRLMVVMMERGPEIVRAAWKIPVGRNMADNFWRPGNMLGAVKVETGQSERVVQGAGPEQMERDDHPDTGKMVKGITLPDWNQLKDLCLSAASSLPGLRIQAWDIAMCPGGPVLVEVNIGGDFNLPQAATGAGLLDDSFRSFLAKYSQR